MGRGVPLRVDGDVRLNAGEAGVVVALEIDGFGGRLLADGAAHVVGAHNGYNIISISLLATANINQS